MTGKELYMKLIMLGYKSEQFATNDCRLELGNSKLYCSKSYDLWEIKDTSSKTPSINWIDATPDEAWESLQ